MVNEALVKHYLEILDGYEVYMSDFTLDFLDQAMIADLELVAKLYGNGMSISQWEALGEALEIFRSPDRGLGDEEDEIVEEGVSR